MPNEQNQMKKRYRVCLLAYSRVAHVAREVVRELADSDIEYIILESGLADEQAACVEEARRLGCEVFIAGPAGAALFASRYSYPVISFHVSDMDYLNAIRKALHQGHHHIGIMHYRYAPPLNLEKYEYLMQTELTELVYDEIPKVYEMAKKTACDVLIGPVVVQDAADAAGKDSLLIYAGKEAVRDACLKAGDLIKKMYDTRRSRIIAESVLNTTQMGIVVTDTDGVIEFFNRTMQNYTGLGLHQVSGRPLRDIFPNVPIDSFLKSGYNQHDSYHLINSTMMRCVFRRIVVGLHEGGVLLTFHPNPHNRKKDRQHPVYAVAPVYKLEKVTALSKIMSHIVRLCRQISPVEYATALVGPSGCGREELAHCLHNASGRANGPCITIDCATIIDERAVETLYGYSHGKHTTDGLLLTASGGSVILKHPGLAGPHLQAVLQEALTVRQFFRPGMETPVTLDLMFYTVVTEEEFHHLPAGFRRLLSILMITVPPLHDRKEDICPLFSNYVRQQMPGSRESIVNEAMERVLTTYSWPGNVVELRAVSTRYAVLLKKASSRTARYRYHILLEAIGEDLLESDIFSQYSVLCQRPVEQVSSFQEAVQVLRAIFDETYEETAARLHMSRTTLWRLLHK